MFFFVLLPTIPPRCALLRGVCRQTLLHAVVSFGLPNAFSAQSDPCWSAQRCQKIFLFFFDFLPEIRPRCALLRAIHRWTQLHVAVISDLFNTFPALSSARRPGQRFQKILLFFLVFPSTISTRCAPLRVVQRLTLLHVGIFSILLIVFLTLSQPCQGVERLWIWKSAIAFGCNFPYLRNLLLRGLSCHSWTLWHIFISFSLFTFFSTLPYAFWPVRRLRSLEGRDTICRHFLLFGTRCLTLCHVCGGDFHSFLFKIFATISDAYWRPQRLHPLVNPDRICSVFVVFWDLPSHSLPSAWPRTSTPLLHILPNTVTRLLVRAAIFVSGSSASHTIAPLVLSGTCRFVLCLAYGRSFYLHFFTSFPTRTYACWSAQRLLLLEASDRTQLLLRCFLGLAVPDFAWFMAKTFTVSSSHSFFRARSTMRCGHHKLLHPHLAPSSA